MQIVTLVDTDKIAAKLLIMLPYQTEPEHSHPVVDDQENLRPASRNRTALPAPTSKQGAENKEPVFGA